MPHNFKKNIWLGTTAFAVLAVSAPALAADFSGTDQAAYSHTDGTAQTATGAVITATSTTNNTRAWGILVHANPADDSASTLTVSDTQVTTTGRRAHGIQSGANGANSAVGDNSSISLSSGVTVSTSGNDAFALHAIEGTTISGAAAISTSGTNGFGAFAESSSKINLTGGSITTSGAKGFGLIANNDLDAAAGGAITGAGVTISTSGTGAHGAFADQADTSIALNGGSIATTGSDAYGVLANIGNVSTNGTAISTEADWAFAVVARGEGSVTLTGGTVTTDGVRAYGLLAEDNSTITSSAAIVTSGSKAHGAQTSTDAGAGRTGGTIIFNGGSITTSGADAFALHAIGKGEISGNVNILTSGNNGFGAFAESDSIITLANSSITTSGANGHAVLANNDAATVGGVITLTNVTVKTTGADAAGLFAGNKGTSGSAGGSISMTGGSVTAEGAGAAAVVVDGSGSIIVEGATLSSADGPTVLAKLKAAGDNATILFKAGTIATANNGTLLNVTRTGDGVDGEVTFTLDAGATAKGNIVDLTASPIGGTNVFIDADAIYEGTLSGIKDVVANEGSELTFASGTIIGRDIRATGSTLTFDPTGAIIGGDVSLEDRSWARGGSVGSPIIVDGSVLVDPTSMMGGNWYIAGSLGLDGMLSPGNSLGVIAVAGNFSAGPNSNLIVEIDGNGGADLLDVQGTADLDGTLTVRASDPAGAYRDGQTYTIIEADGGVNNSFAAVEVESIFLDVDVDYQENSVDLIISVEDDAFAQVAVTSNQAAAAAALATLDQTGSSLALYNSIALLTSEEEAQAAFEQLAGDSFASVKTGLIENAHLMSDAVLGRLASASDTEGASGTDLWMTGLGSWIVHGTNANAGDMKSSTGGAMIGLDTRFGSNFRVGVAGGYSQSKFRMEQRSAAAESDNWHLGLYAGTTSGPLGVNLGVNYVWHKLNMDRNVAFFGDRLTADYKARTLQAFGELSYRLEAGSFAVEPFAGVNHVSLKTRSVTETGELAALRVKGDTTDTTFTTLGLRAFTPVNIGSNEVRLRGLVGWRHALGDVVPNSTQAFVGSDDFTIEGVSVAKDMATVELGFDARLSTAATFSLGYFGRFGDDSSQNGVKARFAVAF